MAAAGHRRYLLHIAWEYRVKGKLFRFHSDWSKKKNFILNPTKHLAVGLKVAKVNNLGNKQWNQQKDLFKAEEIKRFTDTLEGMGHLERQ